MAKPLRVIGVVLFIAALGFVGLCVTKSGMAKLKIGARPSTTLRLGHKPIAPTHHFPGSVAKLDVMTGRLLRGETLFHPHDAGVQKGDEATAPSTIERLVYSGSSRKSVVKTKVPGKTHEWVGQRKITTYILTEKNWRKMQPYIPLRHGLDSTKKKVQLAQHRNAINGMLFVLFRGCGWDKLPERYYYFGVSKKRKGHCVYTVWHKWSRNGLWLRLLQHAKLVDDEDRIQWHRLQRVTVQA
jgi:transposase